ncbi:MAG: Crp/Fnr family transcriptional regulator [Hyphomonadaceae bacterium]
MPFLSASIPDNSWLRALSSATRTAIQDAAKIRRFEVGAVIQALGAKPTGVFIIVEGAAQASISNAEGNSFLLRILRVGDVLSEMPTDDEPAMLEVIARNSLTALWLSWDMFRSLRSRYPDLHHHSSVALGRRYVAALRVIEELGLMSVDDRILVRLGRMAEELEGAAALEHPTVLDITQAELAAMTAAARQTTNKALSSLSTEGLIELRFKEIVVTPELVACARRRAANCV